VKEFKLTALVTISVDTIVKAETLEEAIKIAEQRSDILNSQFQRPDINEMWVAYDYDGVPYNIRLEE